MISVNRALSDGERLRNTAESLLLWYRENRRELPWRSDPTPYRVWVSEIMLQQTRIEAVKPYFERFLTALPDVTALADAEEDTVLKLWEGLGYYSRARNLHRAAVICRDRYGGNLPDTVEGLLALPGIGSYTAGAVASLAYGIRVPAVDGNVMRVITRICADDGDITESGTKKRITGLLQDEMPGEDPGAFNEALMELGERICIPGGEPLCGRCPAAPWCAAHETGGENRYPVRAGKKLRRAEDKTVLVISCGGRFALRKRPDKGLLAGMYELPTLEGHRSRQEMEAWIRRYTDKYELRELPESRHIFTHVEWNMIGYRISSPEPWGEDWFFESAGDIRSRRSLPRAFRAYVSELQAE